MKIKLQIILNGLYFIYSMTATQTHDIHQLLYEIPINTAIYLYYQVRILLLYLTFIYTRISS